jgi:uncharacterized protein with FMN-binding domain
MTRPSKRMKVPIAAISVALLVAGCATVDRSAARLTAAPNTVVTRSRSASSQDSSYADGVYTAIGRYGSLPSSITVTATLSDNIITAVEVTPHATDATSRDYQERFADAVPAQVVGKPIDEVRVGRLAGASGTPNGFNAAIQRIKEQSRRSGRQP